MVFIHVKTKGASGKRNELGNEEWKANRRKTFFFL